MRWLFFPRLLWIRASWVTKMRIPQQEHSNLILVPSCWQGSIGGRGRRQFFPGPSLLKRRRAMPDGRAGCWRRPRRRQWELQGTFVDIFFLGAFYLRFKICCFVCPCWFESWTRFHHWTFSHVFPGNKKANGSVCLGKNWGPTSSANNLVLVPSCCGHSGESQLK